MMDVPKRLSSSNSTSASSRSGGRISNSNRVSPLVMILASCLMLQSLKDYMGIQQQVIYQSVPPDSNLEELMALHRFRPDEALRKLRSSDEEEEDDDDKYAVDNSVEVDTGAGNGTFGRSDSFRLVHKQERRKSSKDATVMAMAQGYDISTHRRFVGSLRKSGFEGTNMIAAEKRGIMKKGVAEYLARMNVTIVELEYVPCDKPIFEADEIKDAKTKEGNTCVKPYPDIKVRWGRYPRLRDALKECTACTGPVLISDARDVLFQRDPLGDDVEEIEGLQLFAEHHTISAGHPFTQKRVSQCYDDYSMAGKPMLCSGTTVGTREAMLEYMTIMYHEMKHWMTEEKCFFKSHGGDQAIMNYLYYTGKFNHLNPQIFWPQNGIVNTVGTLGVGNAKVRFRSKVNTYPGSSRMSWAGAHIGLINHRGFFTELDGSLSRVVHQYDRFGNQFIDWFDKKSQLYD